MNFMEIAKTRQSCRSYDPDRPVEREKIEAIMEAARLAPSACNGQPYHITVCTGETAKEVAKHTMDPVFKINKFAMEVPVMIVISDKPYVKTAAYGSQTKGINYRSIDMGILASYITAEAAVQGLGSCILGWIDSDPIREICHLDGPVQLVISLGYSGPRDSQREKIRKDLDELVTYM